MNYIPLVSKITERGQITLPKRVREASIFKQARAVEFEQVSDAVVIRPVKAKNRPDEYRTLLNHTMRDWSHSDNDDLFDFTPL